MQWTLVVRILGEESEIFYDVTELLEIDCSYKVVILGLSLVNLSHIMNKIFDSSPRILTFIRPVYFVLTC